MEEIRIGINYRDDMMNVIKNVRALNKFEMNRLGTPISVRY